MIPYRKLMGCKKWQNYLLIALSVLALFFLVTNQELGTWNDVGDEDEKTAVELFRAKYGDNRQLETSIRLTDGAHVDIFDSVLQSSKKEVIIRQIVTKSLRLTAMLLKPPPGLSEENLDTITWEIDRESLNIDNYVTTMIEEMFLSGKVPMSKRAYAKILDLGLGGGYLNSFLHHNYPNLDITVVEHDQEMLKIARKWFQLKEDARHRVILSDAASFVRNAANKINSLSYFDPKASVDKELLTVTSTKVAFLVEIIDLNFLDKNSLSESIEFSERVSSMGAAFECLGVYDIILADACGTKAETWIICPNENFVNADIPQHIANILTEKGALIMNVLCNDLDLKKVGGKLKSIYSTAFKHCILKQSHSPSNLVMTCMQHTPPQGLAPQYEKFANYDKYGARVSELF